VRGFPFLHNGVWAPFLDVHVPWGEEYLVKNLGIDAYSRSGREVL
jgi:hypothetical protein